MQTSNITRSSIQFQSFGFDKNKKIYIAIGVVAAFVLGLVIYNEMKKHHVIEHCLHKLQLGKCQNTVEETLKGTLKKALPVAATCLTQGPYECTAAVTEAGLKEIQALL